ncbi:MAG: phage gp6-like head-tail connector protein [Prevotella sp.]|nr:phage gp6-like head-tail connector protein [Prevotella sp.]
MKWLKLDYIKQHSRIDYDCEDDLLTIYAEAAEETVLNLIDRSFENVVVTYDGIPNALVQASLMLVDLSYMQRSPVSVQSLSVVPYTFDMLVKPYMCLTGYSK